MRKSEKAKKPHNMSTTLFRHVASGNVYRFIGMVRGVKTPDVLDVVYATTQESSLRDNTSVTLPIGTLWHRNADDFFAKFEPVKQ
jgi:hypothetical protein